MHYACARARGSDLEAKGCEVAIVVGSAHGARLVFVLHLKNKVDTGRIARNVATACATAVVEQGIKLLDGITRMPIKDFSPRTLSGAHLNSSKLVLCVQRFEVLRATRRTRSVFIGNAICGRTLAVC